jgi:hypothetical protein
MKSNKRLVFICFLISVFLTVSLSNTSNATPSPDIKANGSDTDINITTNNNLIISVALNAGSYSDVNADWWVAADTPFGWHYYLYPPGWYYAPDLSNLQPAYQGALFSLGLTELLNITGLPSGTYTFYFAIDTIMNGQIDFDHLYHDGVVVNITEVLVEQDVTVPGGGGGFDVSFSGNNGQRIRITLRASNTSMQPYGFLVNPDDTGEYTPLNDTAQNGENMSEVTLNQTGTYVLTIFDGSNIGGAVHVRVEVIT